VYQLNLKVLLSAPS